MITRRRLMVDGADANGYDFVDMGSAGKWATCDTGASKPEEIGKYFAWGETEGSSGSGKVFSWTNYKLCNGSGNTLTKYCTNSSYGTVDNKTVLDLEDDAARVNMGGTWRIPTAEEYNELISKCNNEWTTNYNGTGVSGVLFTLKTDSSKQLFLPATGYIGVTITNNTNCFRWLNCLFNTTNSNLGKNMTGSSSIGGGNQGYLNRCYGLPIRAILSSY